MLTALLFTAALAATTPPPATPLGDAVTACYVPNFLPVVQFTDGGLGVVLPTDAALDEPLLCVLGELGLPEWARYRFDGWVEVDSTAASFTRNSFTLTWVDEGLMILDSRIAPR